MNRQAMEKNEMKHGCLRLPWQSPVMSPFLLACVLWALRGSCLPAAEPADDLFVGDRVFELDITIPESGIANLRTYHWRRWRGTGMPRPKALATVREAGVTYTNVSVHLKGSAGSFRSVDDKPAMTLNFDKHVDDQEIRGYDKIYLNNSVQDRSFCNEKICRELYNAAGIPTPRATHAWVTLNGRTLGLYVVIEGFNKPFLKRHFEDVSGNLYDGGFLQDINADLSVNSGENPEDKSDLRALFRAAIERDVRKRFQWLGQLLDLDRYYTLMALDTMTWNWDGYTIHHNNFRLYHDMDGGRFIFIPHGMDQMFEQPQAPIFPRFDGIVSRALLELPAARVAYYDRLNSLMGNVFSEEKINRRIQEITTALQTTLREKDRYVAKRQQSASLGLQFNVTRRAAFLKSELSAGNRVPKFGSDGSLAVTEWTPRVFIGRPSMDRTREGQRQLLRIGIPDQGQVAMGRWSSTLTLKQGRYRFSGLMQTIGADPASQDPRGGAGLRVSGAPTQSRRRGTSGWAPYYVDFVVERPVQEIELGCELRAGKGAAVFDLNSLRINRLQ